MKKLLTTITLSALVGTSAGNLKPMFAEKIVNTGFKSNQLNNKDISIKNENNTNPFDVIRMSNINCSIIVSSFAPDGTVWVGTSKNGLWKSTDGINFEIMSNDLGIPKTYIKTIAVTLNGDIYIGIGDEGAYTGVYKSHNEQKFEIINDLKFSLIQSIKIAPDGTVWVGTSKNGGMATLFRTIFWWTFVFDI